MMRSRQRRSSVIPISGAVKPARAKRRGAKTDQWQSVFGFRELTVTSYYSFRSRRSSRSETGSRWRYQLLKNAGLALMSTCVSGSSSTSSIVTLSGGRSISNLSRRSDGSAKHSSCQSSGNSLHAGSLFPRSADPDSSILQRRHQHKCGWLLVRRSGYAYLWEHFLLLSRGLGRYVLARIERMRSRNGCTASSSRS